MATNHNSDQYPDLFELLEQHQDSIVDLGSLINDGGSSISSSSGGNSFLDSFNQQHSLSSPSGYSSSSFSQTASPSEVTSEVSNIGSISSPASNISDPVVGSPEVSAHAASPQEMIKHNEEQNPESEKDSDADILREYSKRYQDVPEDSGGSERNSEDGNLCHVCGAAAGKHTYYGGKACPGCRAFFRRAVQSKYYDIFTCSKGDGKCEIDQNTRKDCQYCRFHKCMTNGMKPSWVLSNVERDKRFNKRRKAYGGGDANDEAIASGVRITEGSVNVRRDVAPPPSSSQQRSSSSSSTAAVSLNSDPIIELSIEDWHAIEKYNSFTNLTMHNFFHEYLCSNPVVMRDLTSLSYFGGTANNQVYYGFQSMHDKFSQKFYLDVEDFASLSMSDQRKLMSANGPLLATYKSVFNIMDMKNCLTKRMALDTRSGQYPALSDINRDLERLNLKDRTPHLSYTMFYTSPWAANYTDELRHFELHCKIISWPRDSGSKPVDCVQVTLMIIIIAFTMDPQLEQELERPDLVKQIRAKYIYLLQRYLKFKYRRGDADSRFSHSLQMTSYAKEVHEIQSKRISTDWH